MKVRNLVLSMALGANVLTAHSAVLQSAGTTAAITAANTAVLISSNNAKSSEKSTANVVSSTILNSQNTVIVECALERERVKNDDEWLGTIVPSLKKTLNTNECKLHKEILEQLNNTHYKFGKVKGIFDGRQTEHVLIELVEVNK